MRNFLVRSKVDNGVAVVYPKGHLDAHGVERFEKELVKLIDAGVVQVVVNGRDLSYISSAGMGVIMGYLDEIREKGGDIRLCAVNERVYEIFDLVGFTDIYSFMDTEELALQSFMG